MKKRTLKVKTMNEKSKCWCNVGCDDDTGKMTGELHDKIR